jgi:ABC-type spermidine/putrescine transport system permease subunit I
MTTEAKPGNEFSFSDPHSWRALKAKTSWIGLTLPSSALLLLGLIVPVLAILRGVGLRSGAAILPPGVLVRVELTTLRIATLVSLFATLFATITVLMLRKSSLLVQKIVLAICLFPIGVNITFRVFGVQFLIAGLGSMCDSLRAMVPSLSFSPDRILFTQTATIVGLTHWLFPVAALVIFSGLGNVRQDLIEAGELLAAPRLAVLLRIVLPALRSQILLCFTLCFCLAYGAYITPAALGGVGDVTLGRLIGSLLDEGQSQVAALPAIIGILTPLAVSGLIGILAKARRC